MVATFHSSGIFPFSKQTFIRWDNLGAIDSVESFTSFVLKFEIPIDLFNGKSFIICDMSFGLVLVMLESGSTPSKVMVSGAG